MNEATLEAKLSAEIQRIFPGIGIEHQKVINLKFGHHSIKVDGTKRESTYGRLDVLLEFEGRHLAVLELKRQGLALTDDDRQQGLSYARLLEPQAPLVVLTNGSELKIYQTFDGTELPESTLGAETLKAHLKAAAVIASTSRDEAIRLLLGQCEDIWADILRSFTKNQFAERTGDIADISYPLVEGFSIARNSTSKILAELKSETSFIVLTGPPLCGKTNALFLAAIEILEDQNLVPFYVDAHSLHHGILDEIANLFATTVFSTLTGDDVRRWLITSFSTQRASRLVILIDGWSSSVSEKLNSDLSQLLQLCQGRKLSVVLAVDDSTNRRLSTEENRPTKTTFGRMKKEISIGPLDSVEMQNATQFLSEHFGLLFFDGIQSNFEYRSVRFFRIWAAALKNNKPPKASTDGRIAMNVLSPITGPAFLKMAWQNFSSSPELRNDLRLLATTYIEDTIIRDSDPKLNLLSHGRLLIFNETAEKILGSDRLRRLLKTGHVNFVDGPNHRTFYIPTLPELVAAAGAHVIGNKVTEFMKSGAEDAAYSYLMKSSSSFPMSDAVAALAVIEVAKNNQDYFPVLLSQLLDDPPRKKVVTSDGRHLIDFEGIILDIPNEYIEGESIIENMHPWLILSHLAVSEIGILPEILEIVGSCKHLLRRIDAGPFPDRPPFHIHHLPDDVEAICPSTGLIEPITGAILAALSAYPDEIKQLAEGAAQNGNLALAMRLQAATNLAKSDVDPKVSSTAGTILQILENTFRMTFENLHKSTE